MLILPDVAEYDLDIPAGDDFVHEIVSVVDDAGSPVDYSGGTFTMTLFSKGVALGTITPTVTYINLALGNFSFKIPRAQTDPAVLPYGGAFRIDYHAANGDVYPFSRGSYYRSYP